MLALFTRIARTRNRTTFVNTAAIAYRQNSASVVQILVPCNIGRVNATTIALRSGQKARFWRYATAIVFTEVVQLQQLQQRLQVRR